MLNKLPVVVSVLIVTSFGTITAAAPTPAEETAPVITNLRYGLICGPDDNRRICFQTNLIQVTNESGCVSNREPIRCTWYGYSFDYEAPADVTINCRATTDKVVPNGNPRERFPPTQEIKYNLNLKMGVHHFIIDQYMTGENGDLVPVRSEESCSFGGQSLLTADFQFQFADKTEPIDSVPDVNDAPP
jgi:hypothetical protein